jgi:hypothetical protein
MNYIKSALMLALITGGIGLIIGSDGLIVLRLLIALLIGWIFHLFFSWREKNGLSGHEEWIWGTWYGRFIRRLEVKYQNYLNKKAP